jgi:hypothetical protein
VEYIDGRNKWMTDSEESQDQGVELETEFLDKFNL